MPWRYEFESKKERCRAGIFQDHALHGVAAVHSRASESMRGT
jgi:hypothetical protein